MPVVGHAFVGLATAACTNPRHAGKSDTARWLAAMAVLAYLPDIVSQFVLLTGATWGPLLGHSVWFALAASIALARPLAVFFHVSTWRMFVIVGASLLAHDLLDAFQATDKRPLWPYYAHPVTAPMHIPAGAVAEFVCFGIAFVVFMTVLTILRAPTMQSRMAGNGLPTDDSTDKLAPHHGANFLSPHGAGDHGSVTAQPVDRRRAWPAYGIILIVVASAGGTHYLRSLRERQFHQAEALLEQRHHADALEVLDMAARWPGLALPGRIDYARATAFHGLGDRRQAEQYYLASLAADPDYFWCVADVAFFFAPSFTITPPPPAPCNGSNDESNTPVPEPRTLPCLNLAHFCA